MKAMFLMTKGQFVGKKLERAFRLSFYTRWLVQELLGVLNSNTYQRSIVVYRGTCRAFGNSAPLLDSDGMDEAVDLLYRFVVETLKLQRANFVGLSVGGMILQHFASRYPELVQTATIIDSSPKFGLSGDIDPKEFINPILTQLQSGVDVRSFSTAMVDAVVGPKCLDSVKKEAIDSMSRATRSGLALTTRLIGTHNALECLPKITAPCLVLVGEDDSDTPPSYAQAIAEAIDGASLEIISGAGHISNLENPDQVNELLGAFLLAHEVE